MPTTSMKVLALALIAVQCISAHTIFSNFFVNGVDQGDGTCVRMSNIPSKATNPVQDLTSNDMACGFNGQTGVARVCPVNASSTLTFEYRTWPDASHPGSLDPSHKGPCAVYPKKVDSAITNTAAGDGWFKIFSEDYDETASKWCTEKLIANNGLLSVQLPADLQGGYYLVRSELLALHQADKSPADPQFYVGCAQVFLESSGTNVPANTVAIPGYVNMTNPAMTFNIWETPMALPYPTFGPPVYETTPQRDLSAREEQETQTEGLQPAGCVLENANWCGIELDAYTTQEGCWNASTSCYSQLTTCYSTAPPTGSKNCKIWESKCEAIQAQCKAGTYTGPPNPGANLNPAPATANLPSPANAYTGSPAASPAALSIAQHSSPSAYSSASSAFTASSAAQPYPELNSLHTMTTITPTSPVITKATVTATDVEVVTMYEYVTVYSDGGKRRHARAFGYA